MKYSEIALKVLAAKECGIIKSNAQFWSTFENEEELEKVISNNDKVKIMFERISSEFNDSEDLDGVICKFDNDFPVLNQKVKNKGDKPFLLFYKGDLSLLHELNNNVAVIGLTDPDSGIVEREKKYVREFIKKGLNIVSGLAIGCDTVAHKTCLEESGKTIAILPSPISKIYPEENRSMAEEIVDKGGLLISEYYKEPSSRMEAIKRFVDRDRLQAMFSKAVILIASYRKDEGDSGSRHAIEAASKFELDRYVMYDDLIDADNIKFGLNKDLIENKGVKVMNLDSIRDIIGLKNINLEKEAEPLKQTSIFDFILK